MTLSKQVSRQGLVIHRVMLTWGPSPRYTGEKTVSERLTYRAGGNQESSPAHPWSSLPATVSSDLPH